MDTKIIKAIEDLPEILKHKQWDTVVSLGGTCQVAFQLKRLKLRMFSGPFDWLFSTEPDKVDEALDKDFEGWLLKEELREEPSQTECRRIIDERYHMIHQHIFPADRTYEESYDDVKAIVDRRIRRLLSFKEGDKDILFVRTNLSPDEAKTMGEVISRQYGTNAYLLVMNHTKDQEVRMLPQVRENVFTFEIFDENENTGQKWQGHDEHWDLVFADVTLKGNNELELYKDILFEGVYPYENPKGGDDFRWTEQKAVIDVSRFSGKTLRFHLQCKGNNKLTITDNKANVLHECLFGRVGLIEAVKLGGRYISDRTFDISIAPDITKVTLACRDEGIPTPEDPRKLGVCILEITEVAP